MIGMLLFAFVITCINVTLIYISLSDNIRFVKTLEKKLKEYRQLKDSIPAIIPSPELLKKANDFDAYFEKVFKTLDESKEHVANHHSDG